MAVLSSAPRLMEERVRSGLDLETYVKQLVKILLNGVGAR